MPKGLMIAIMGPKAGRGGKMPEPPEPIGGKAKMPMVEEKSEERSEHKMQPGMVSPEAVSFRTGDEVCGNCRHMGKDGGCGVLGMEVGQQDSCNVFSQREDEEPEEMAEAEEPETEEQPA